MPGDQRARKERRRWIVGVLGTGKRNLRSAWIEDIGKQTVQVIHWGGKGRGSGRCGEEAGMGEAETVDQVRKASSGAWHLVSFRSVLLTHTDPLGTFLKCRFRVSRSGAGLQFCISTKFPEDAEAACPDRALSTKIRGPQFHLLEREECRYQWTNYLLSACYVPSNLLSALKSRKEDKNPLGQEFRVLKRR